MGKVVILERMFICLLRHQLLYAITPNSVLQLLNLVTVCWYGIILNSFQNIRVSFVLKSVEFQQI